MAPFAKAAIHNSHLVNRLEEVIHNDRGHRGLNSFWNWGALLKAAKIINACQDVYIVTGFYIPAVKRAETDGPLGAVNLAAAIASLGKRVAILTDPYESQVIKSAIKQSNGRDISFITFNKKEKIDSFAKQLNQGSCVISIERLGRAVNGRYYNMGGHDETQYTLPFDDMMLLTHRQYKTIGIGDGGNEIGMGNKYKKIMQYVSHGPVIASIVKADVLIMSGTSNWGGDALAFALQIINPRKNVLTPTLASSRKILKGIVDAGAVDGITLKNTTSVDGFMYDDIHANILRTLQIITRQRLKPTI